MANFVGAIEQFNPYIQQIPTEAYTKVGMFKEQQYQAGLQKVQDTIDYVAGLDIANEGGRQYLRARVDELTNSLNKYSQSVDFSNPNNVTQLIGLAKPLYQDENIVNDVINTGVYRSWAKEAQSAFKAGKMELGQYVREASEANRWLNSTSAGADYTGRTSPNTATKKDLVDRIIKAKKDGLEKNEFVYDVNYSKDTPYYVKSTNKYYSEADFNNFIANNLMSSGDREMLMNEHWYENQGVPIETLQKEDIALYQSKIDDNLKKIEAIKNDPLLYAGDKKTEAEQTIRDLQAYNKQLSEGKIKFLQELNLADPSSRDVFHRDLAETRFVDSMQILRDQTQKEELQKNEQWFLEKGKELDATLEAIKNAQKGTGTTKKGNPKNMNEIGEVTDEVSVFTPVDPNAPKTELSLNTIQQGWQLKNDEVVESMNGLIGKLQQNGVDMSQYIAGWDQVQVGNKAGAAKNVPRFRSEAAKNNFYNLVAGLNFAYTKEALDGKMDNQSFQKWIKENVAGYTDDDPNSKFTLADKMVSDALNSLKGTSALLPKLDKLFADKGVVRTLSQIDEAIKNKKDMANVYREALLKSNALTGEEQRNIINIGDDDLMNKSFILDKEKEEKRFAGKKVVYRVHQEGDGTYSIYQDVFAADNDRADDFQRYNRGGLKIPSAYPDYDPTKEGVTESRKIVGGYQDYDDAYNDVNIGGSISALKGISEKSLEKAENFIKQTYSYVQEDLNTTVTNLKKDESAYGAIKDALSLFINRAKLQASPEDLTIDGIANPTVITGIKDMEILGAKISNSEDIFNPNPMYEVQFTASVPNKDGELKPTLLNGKVSLRSFLATNPNYKTSEYTQYFAPALYAQKDAYDRIKATINPLEGSEASYSRRQDIRPVYNYTKQDNSTGFVYDDSEKGDNAFGNNYQWETLPVEKDGKQTMLSYQVVSLGQNTNLGNIKNKDGQQYQPGAYYIKLKIPTSTGQPKVIFLKKPNGDSYVFNSASYAHFTLRDLIFNNPEIKMDEVDPKTNEANYLTTDPSTLRGILNSQLSYNGYSKIETVKLKDALGKEVEKQQLKAQETQLAR